MTMPPRSSKHASGRRKASTKAHDAIVQENIEFVLSSMQDPHNIRHCGRCLLGALTVLTPSIKAGKEYHTIPKIWENDAFWNHIYTFVVMKRTEEEVNGLLVRFSQCNCDFKDTNVKGYHDDGLAAEPTLMRRTVSHWSNRSYTPENCAVLIELVYLLRGYLTLCGIKSVAKGEARKWPHTAGELLPYGPDSTIESLLQLYMFVPNPTFFSLIGAITRICRSLIIPTVIKFNISQTMVTFTRMVVDVTMGNLDCIAETTRNGEPPHPASRPNLSRFTFQARSLLEYLQELDALPLDTRTSLLRGSETQLMQLCSSIIYLYFDPRHRTELPSELKEDHRFFIKYGQWLFRFYHMHLYPRPDIPVHPQIFQHDKLVFPPPASRRSTDEVAIHYISFFHEDQRCSTYLCPNSLQSAGKSFQRCGRCNIVSYCSRECQIKAWREEKYPHKRICPILRTLVDVGGGPAMFFPTPNQIPSIPATPPTECRKIRTFNDLRPYILQRWKSAGVSEDDLKYVELWGDLHDTSRDMPDGTEWTPGFEDYNELIANVSEPIGPGPKPLFLDRLARWPSEVAKEKAHLEVQAFWNEEIEC